MDRAETERKGCDASASGVIVETSEDGRSDIEKGNFRNGNDSCVSHDGDNSSDKNSGHDNSPSEAPPAWEEKFQLLVEYKMKHGTTNVAKKPNRSLYNWMYHQRKYRTQLSSSQQQRLESIGFEWNNEERRKLWMKRFGELVEFNEKYGHTFVPNKWKENPQLADWVKIQRRSCKLQWRIALLNDIDFAWSGSQFGNVAWMKRYEELVEYKDKYGNTCVPKAWKENPQLASWVKTQRRDCKEQWRIDLLDDIGFVWSLERGTTNLSCAKAKWMKRYGELVDFKEKHGHTSVPLKWKENPQLAKWVECQRRRCKMVWRIDLLNSIGFDWSRSPYENYKWMNRYVELVEYKEKYGTTCVPATSKENPQLATWVRIQRQLCKEQWRIDFLNDIGFVWSFQGKTRGMDDREMDETIQGTFGI